MGFHGNQQENAGNAGKPSPDMDPKRYHIEDFQDNAHKMMINSNNITTTYC